jgi:hypothetical protein
VSNREDRYPDDASFMTGADLLTDGGYTAS